MLYTGGTTGMPKGVMYAMGGTTSGFVQQRLPAARLVPPTDAAEIGRRSCAPWSTAATQSVSIPCVPADARHRHVARGDDPALLGGVRRHAAGRSLDADELLARGRSASGPRPSSSSATRSPSRSSLRSMPAPSAGKPYDTSQLVRMIVSSRRDVDRRGQGAAARPDPAGHAARRDRDHRGRDGHAGHDAGHAGRDGPLQPGRRRPRCSPTTTARCSRAPARSAWWPPAATCRSATSRTREVGAHVPRDRRRALLVPRRHGEGRRRRLARSCSAAAAR